jgi:hypothetical protein
MKALTLCALLALGAVACDRAGAAPENDPPAAAANETGEAKLMDECPGGESAKNGEAHGSCGDSQPAAEGQQKFGSFAMTESAPLASVVASLGEEAKKTVQVSGTVDSVCQKKGCWMVLKDGDVVARVFTHAGEFYLPTSTEKGRTAVVEGEIEARTVSEKFAKHLAEDQGRDPSEVSGSQRELVINATAIALK